MQLVNALRVKRLRAGTMLERARMEPETDSYYAL